MTPGWNDREDDSSCVVWNDDKRSDWALKKAEEPKGQDRKLSCSILHLISAFSSIEQDRK